MAQAGEGWGGAQVVQAFEALEDPRSRECTYPLQELLLAALCAVTSGADDFETCFVAWRQQLCPSLEGLLLATSHHAPVLDDACVTKSIRSLRLPTLD